MGIFDLSPYIFHPDPMSTAPPGPPTRPWGHGVRPRFGFDPRPPGALGATHLWRLPLRPWFGHSGSLAEVWRGEDQGPRGRNQQVLLIQRIILRGI